MIPEGGDAARRLREVLSAVQRRGDPSERARRLGLELLAEATERGWGGIDPAALAAAFQATLSERERHEHGTHYTPEAAILEHVVRPSLIVPWRARVREARAPEDLLALRAELARVRILDPACGCGSFLHVAYRALVLLERELLEKAREQLPAPERPALAARTTVRASQLFGIDTDALAVELAKVTLLLAEEQALGAAPGNGDEPHPPPGSLDENLRCDDALFCAWPAADLILGNPPFQAKNKMRQELGAAYVQRLRERYPGVPGRADYCVYWFRRAHDELAPGARAGLVGTNTVRQNESREGGLGHVVAHGGTITEAVSTMVWPGEAVVHVSVVNWVKGEQDGPKRLSRQEGDAGDGPWQEVVLDRIPPSLSGDVDVTAARPLAANVAAGACYQGQTHGNEGFLLGAGEARAMCEAQRENAEVLFPYLVGEDLLGEPGGRPSRFVIDFHPRDRLGAQRYERPFARVEELVRPAREEAAAAERARNAGLPRRKGKRGNGHHQGFLRRWWWLGYPRGELIARLGGLSRYVVCSRVSKRPIFAFVSAAIRPGDALAVFPLEDDYSFGVLQSAVHAAWLKARCSTFKGDLRYTSSTVFDSFPWPQAPGAERVAAVARAAAALRAARRDLERRHGLPLRALYASMETPGAHLLLKDAHAALDAAARAAYGLGTREDPLAFLLALNRACADREARGEAVIGPGVPPGVPAEGLVTSDAVEAPPLR